MTKPAAVGPFLSDPSNPTKKDTHWHAALGVYDCDHWMGDSTGTGVWNWPNATPAGSPARASNTNVYAGLHSHDDGVIHMEPAVSEEAGKNATVGLYFEFGGWKLSETGFTFLGTTVKNGDKCGTQPGTLQWMTASWDGNTAKDAKQKYTVQTGNPAKWKLHQYDIVVIAFLPSGKSITSHREPAVVAEPGDCARGRERSATRHRHDGAGRDADYDRTEDRRHHERPHRLDGDADDVQTVKAVVLVGGEGTRLRPLTFTTPKPLLPIANQPHLERQIAWLAAHGVDEVVLSMGYLPDAFHAHFRPDGCGHDTFGDVVLRYAVEDEPLGTAGAIRFAAEGIDERVIICNGDILTGLDLDAMVRFHDEHGAEATISLTQVEDPSAFGVVPTQADGERDRVRREARAGQGAEQLDQRRHLRARARRSWPASHRASTCRSSGRPFPGCSPNPVCCSATRATRYWLDIGTPEKYLQAHVDALAGLLTTPPAPARARFRPASGCRATQPSSPRPTSWRRC